MTSPGLYLTQKLLLSCSAEPDGPGIDFLSCHFQETTLGVQSGGSNLFRKGEQTCSGPPTSQICPGVKSSCRDHCQDLCVSGCTEHIPRGRTRCCTTPLGWNPYRILRAGKAPPAPSAAPQKTCFQTLPQLCCSSLGTKAGMCPRENTLERN